MNVSLTPQLGEWVQKRVASGTYNNASEVMREALRVLIEREEEREVKLQALRQAIQEGVDSGPPEPLDMAEIKRQARAEVESAYATQQK